MRRKNNFYIGAILYVGAMLCVSIAHASQFPSLTASELKASLESGSVVVYDIRTEGEYLAGHIPGAINVLPQDIRQIGSQLPGNKRPPIVFYFRGVGCSLSRVAAMEAYKLGHEDIRIFTGGLPEWTASGYPVAK